MLRDLFCLLLSALLIVLAQLSSGCNMTEDLGLTAQVMRHERKDSLLSLVQRTVM